MSDIHSTPAVVVGIDGSPAARSAAVWAAREAAGRNLPLRLVHVIHASGDSGDPVDSIGTARDALADARHAVEAAIPRRAAVKIEAETLRGNPLATLIDLSRSAAMVSVGSIGVTHSCHRAGSTAAALAGSARCPVAVIRGGGAATRPGRIVAEVDASPDNGAVLDWAMAEAELRGVGLQVLASSTGLQHRIDHARQRHPRVPVDVVTDVDDVAQYLADCLAAEPDSVQLFVSGTRDRRSLGWAGQTGGCSVLTVGGAQW
ncbi:universal stress protein [Mycobacterium sp. M1]|uniref:Universal stress protein n=1 Tax=Mycolicibacter acidiphilus TaxID=2835306 RepID=A0ABS5RKS6_9MYCO|nr:universal stress protein [Mycolicibacter acidiphilus]MBS9534860.1 universal stress protein [Mycolicibacter acidiphilus]